MSSKITIIIRMYNSQNTIRRAIESALNQTLNSTEYSVLVIDDGSKDNSTEIVTEYKDIDLLVIPHRGSIGALNLGIKRSKTPYVIYLDSDDWFEKDILELMYNQFLIDPELHFVYSDYYEVSNGIKIVVSTKDNIFNTLAAGILFSKKMLLSFGLYDESLIFPEYDLLMKLLPSVKKAHLSKPLYNYFRHPSSISANRQNVRRGLHQLYEKYGKILPIRNY